MFQECGHISVIVGAADRIAANQDHIGFFHLDQTDQLSLAESEFLLDELWAHANRKELEWHNEWRVGDLVLWDNRCTMHRRDPFDASSRRILHRTQVKGETRPRA